MHDTRLHENSIEDFTRQSAPMVRVHRIDTEGGYQLYFMCPACKTPHAVNNTWEWNGDAEQPSLTPSILVTGRDEDGETRCHTWMTKGRLKFFGDCTHDMAGVQWVDMPEFDPKEINL